MIFYKILLRTKILRKIFFNFGLLKNFTLNYFFYKSSVVITIKKNKKKIIKNFNDKFQQKLNF